MTRGKKTCKILKEIRQQIAEKNEIEYITSECSFQGECLGTCPKCEAEVRYLENELHKRQQLGKVVTIAGISLGVAGTFAACSNPAPQSDEKEDTVKVARYSCVPTIDSLTEQLVVPNRVAKNRKVKDDYIEQVGFISLGDIIPEPPEPPEIEIERFPGIKADYPGGMTALMKFFDEKINYPQDALDEGVEGTVIVEFVVKANGFIGEVTAVKKVHPSLDQEAIRVVQSMERWKPASSNAVLVSSYFQLPVQFKIEKQK